MSNALYCKARQEYFLVKTLPITKSILVHSCRNNCLGHILVFAEQRGGRAADGSGKLGISSTRCTEWWKGCCYSSILTFFFFFLDFSANACGVWEVVLFSVPRAWDPSEGFADTFEWPKLLSSLLFCLCLGVRSALCWPRENAEPWLLRFFDALVNRDIVFLEEPGRSYALISDL